MRGLLCKVPVPGGASTLAKRGGEKGGELAQRLREQQQQLADREFALGAVPGIERARVRAALATCSESDHHVAPESERSAIRT